MPAENEERGFINVPQSAISRLDYLRLTADPAQTKGQMAALCIKEKYEREFGRGERGMPATDKLAADILAKSGAAAAALAERLLDQCGGDKAKAAEAIPAAHSAGFKKMVEKAIEEA